MKFNVCDKMRRLNPVVLFNMTCQDKNSLTFMRHVTIFYNLNSYNIVKKSEQLILESETEMKYSHIFKKK